MNLIILLAIIGMFFTSISAGVGIILGITSCYLLFGESGRKAIKYHLTHWSWWDFNV